MNFTDNAFILICAALVMFMTPGLALFYGGLVRSKNVLATIMQSFIMLGLVSVLWAVCGYSLSFGTDIGGLIGSMDFAFLNGVGMDNIGSPAENLPHLTFMIFQCMFAIITPALISGAFAERMKFGGFMVFSALWLILVYTPMCHWVWGGGWMDEMGALDFASGAVVHRSSGAVALCCAILLGKRKGHGSTAFIPHNLPMTILVRYHLLIPKTATRRDLSDKRVVSELAATAGSAERLDMLYLLSIADSMATGPRAWNAWTRSLFEETYHKAINLLEHGPLSQPETAQRLVSAREKVIGACPDMDAGHVEDALGAMPPRAFLALDTDTLARHIKMVRTLWRIIAEDRIRKPSTMGGKGVCILEAESGKVEGTYRLTIAALDRTGLFATIAGAISLHGMNILSAELFTWNDGIAIDVITVNAPPENLFAEEVWARGNRSIGYALTDKLDIAARLDQQRNSPLKKTKSGPKLRPMVTIDNQGSDFYTIIEVAATDRTGFLFDMAETLSAHDISIHLAKITTISGRAADIFHVRNKTGQKVMDDERISSLRAALIEKAGIA